MILILEHFFLHAVSNFTNVKLFYLFGPVQSCITIGPKRLLYCLNCLCQQNRSTYLTNFDQNNKIRSDRKSFKLKYTRNGDLFLIAN